MEFFDWLGVPQIVVDYLNLTVESADDAAALITRILMISAIVAGALYVVGLLCGGLGLMKMAKREGISYWWIGFLPFGNTYLIGKLAGETQIFGQKCKRIGLYAMLAEIVYVIIGIAMLVLSFMLVNGDFYELKGEGENAYYAFSSELFKMYNPGYGWLITLQNVLEYVSYAMWFVTLFMMCSLFTAFFRKYYARSPFIMTFLCALLPLEGFVLLAVRNNKPVDYQAYQRRRYEEMRKQEQQYYGDLGGTGHAPFSDFGNDRNGTSDGGGNDDPFSDFGGTENGNADGNGGGSGGTDGSPFSDF